MGLYDVPANVDLIKSKTGAEKIHYLGYQQGATQMLYALAKLKDLANSIDVFAAFTPCWFTSNLGDEFYEQNEFALRDIGIFAYNGPTWNEDIFKICTELSPE